MEPDLLSDAREVKPRTGLRSLAKHFSLRRRQLEKEHGRFPELKGLAQLVASTINCTPCNGLFWAGFLGRACSLAQSNCILFLILFRAAHPSPMRRDLGRRSTVRA